MIYFLNLYTVSAFVLESLFQMLQTATRNLVLFTQARQNEQKMTTFFFFQIVLRLF